MIRLYAIWIAPTLFNEWAVVREGAESALQVGLRESWFEMEKIANQAGMAKSVITLLVVSAPDPPLNENAVAPAAWRSRVIAEAVSFLCDLVTQSLYDNYSAKRDNDERVRNKQPWLTRSLMLCEEDRLIVMADSV